MAQQQQQSLRITPSSVIRNPIAFYWLYQSGILTKIARNIQIEYKCHFNYEASTLNPKVAGENVSIQEEICQEIVKELYDLQTASPMQVVEIPQSTPVELEERLSRLREKYGDSIFVVNPIQSHRGIRSTLEKYQLSSLLDEYDNYYSLQNNIYLFAEQQLQHQLLDMLSEADIEKEITTMKEDNFLESYAEKIDHKIQHLEISGKLAEFDGVELWHCTYKSIPHTYMKCTRDTSWLQGLNKPLLHNSHPKTIQNLPLLPPLTLLKPKIEHVNTLIGFLDTLIKKYPTHSPIISSIFQYQNRLMIFTKETWPVDRGWLSYRVAYGDISYQGYLNWLRNHPNDVIVKQTQNCRPSGMNLILQD